ncbi:hypothetical protein LCGC14_2160740, partial [marine sediment metagenome]
RASRRGHDGSIWEDDSIEIFLGVRGRYWHLGINAAGSTYDARAKDSSFNLGKGFRAAAGRGKSQWTLEAAIPLGPMAGTGEAPTEWIGNFCRNRRVTGDLQEAAWSPTYSGDSHLPSRFGRLIFADAPKADPAQTVIRQAVTFLPAAEGVGVVRFDLSGLPAKAKIHRADLRIYRSAQVDGRFDEALTDIEVYPLGGGFAAGAKARASGNPLTVRGPWHDSLDATEALRKRLSKGAAAKIDFFVKACPFFAAEGVCLDVAYEGRPAKIPPQVTRVRALHRAGQTFITFKEINDPVKSDRINWGALKMILDGLDAGGKGRLRYVVYRHRRPITADNLHQAERIAVVKGGSAWNLNGRSVERGIDWNIANRYALVHGHWNPFHPASQDGQFGRDCPMDRLVIQDGQPPLARTTGLYVHTAAAKQKVHYAVVTMLDGVENTLEMSGRNTTGPIAETPGEPEPVLQKEFPPAPNFNYREKRLHYVRWVGPPYCNLPSQYYNWAVGVPTGAAKGHPLELSLHRDDRSYWRTQYRVERDSIVVSPHDFPIPTWWYGYHESLGTLRSFSKGVVQPYTERRILWFVDWVARKWPVDRSRIFVTSVRRVSGGWTKGGLGAGGSGAIHLAVRHPEVFNMALPGHGTTPSYGVSPH